MQGELIQQTLADIIRSLYVGRKSGILYMSNVNEHKRIYFKKGSLIFANSDVETDRLGEYLIRIGIIDRDAFAKASERMKRTGHRFGQTLVEMGYCKLDMMQNKVVAQNEAIIYSLFNWQAGKYRFEQHENPVDEDIILNLSTADIILEGIRRMNDMERIRRAMGDTNSVLSPTENPLLLYQRLSSMSSEEYFILSRSDSKSSIADIMAITPLSNDETLRCLYGLVSAGVLELSGPKLPKESMSHIQETEPLSVPSSLPKLDAKTPLPSQSPLSPASTPIKVKFSRSDTKAPQFGSDVTQEEPSPEELMVRTDIVNKHASLKDSSLYEVLDIKWSANEMEVKKAYYSMAKKYHPDRNPSPHLQEVHYMLEELFVKITEAYQTLSAPLDRHHYDSLLKERGKTKGKQGALQIKDSDAADAAKRRFAAEHFLKGKKQFEENLFFDAIQCFKEAVRLNPDESEYRKLLGAALMKNPKWMKEAEKHFRAALKINPFDPECLFELGGIYEHEGMVMRAQKYYQQAATYDPDNIDIQAKLETKKRPGTLAGIKRIFRRQKP